MSNFRHNWVGDKIMIKKIHAEAIITVIMTGTVLFLASIIKTLPGNEAYSSSPNLTGVCLGLTGLTSICLLIRHNH